MASIEKTELSTSRPQEPTILRKSKTNDHYYVKCPDCEKEMRDDLLKKHRKEKCLKVPYKPRSPTRYCSFCSYSTVHRNMAKHLKANHADKQVKQVK